MKIWIEFPDESRFARAPRDILYTPIFFANEKITGHVRLDNEWLSTYGEDLENKFSCKIKLIGKASLGFLSIGGRPASGGDSRYAIPSLGFKPIYTLEILSIYKRLSLSGLEYDAEDGVRGGRKPFAFQLASSTLDDLQQLASSLKVVTADNASTMDFLAGITPALIVNVQYALVAEIMDENDEVKATKDEEIRIFVSLSEEQVPKSNHPAIAANPMVQFTTTQIISLGPTRNRRGSIPLVRRLSRSSMQQEPNLVTINVDSAEQFTFTRQSDAAVCKVTISLLYNTDDLTNPPPAIYAGIHWLLKSLTTLTLEPMDRTENSEQTDDYFHLRTKVLPSRKLKMKWTDWQRQPEGEAGRARWKSTQSVWLLKDVTAGMTPTFVTPYLSHTYLLNLNITLNEHESKVNRAISSGRHKVELDVPVQVRYDLGLVPSYEIDESLPEYDHTLPEYEEEEGGDAFNVDPDLIPDGLPDLANLDLNVTTSRDEEISVQFPPRQIPHPSSHPASPQ